MIEPRLRFKTDDGSDFPDWEEKELCQVLTEDLYPVANPKGAYTKLAIRSHGKGTFDRYVEAGEGLDVDKMFEVKANRLLVNITFAWELAIAITTEKDEGKLVSHRFPQYKIDGNVDFYRYRFINERMRYDLGIASPGGAGRNRVLNKSAFLKIRKFIPSLSEQQKIADFLSTIDTIIEKQQATVSAWEERKKGVMQKLFSQEVRFKADDGSDFPELEAKSLFDICEYKNKQSVGKNYVGTENMKQNFSGLESLDEETEMKGVCYCKGDTLMSNIRPYLRKTWKADREGVCSTDVLVFHPIDVVSEYLHYLIASDKFISYVMTGVKGVKMPRGDKEHMMKFSIMVPSLPEQQKIADCLSALDAVIEKQKETLEKWQELKKGLLQQMFV